MQKVFDVIADPAMWNILIFVIIPVIIVIARRYLKGRKWEEVIEFINDVVREVEQLKKTGYIVGTVEQMQRIAVNTAIDKVVLAFPFTANYMSIIRTKIDSAVNKMNEEKLKK